MQKIGPASLLLLNEFKDIMLNAIPVFFKWLMCLNAFIPLTIAFNGHKFNFVQGIKAEPTTALSAGTTATRDKIYTVLVWPFKYGRMSKT